MNRMKGFGAACRVVVRKLCKSVGIITAVSLLAVAWTLVFTPSEPLDPGALQGVAGQGVATHGDAALQEPTKGRTAWGSEALNAVRDQASLWAPISVANACGLGASSCFKCHNGTRAPAAKMDKKASPWHPDHQTVNDSCAGCHGGNARIIKKEIAHANLAKDPRAKGDMCANCHKSGNAPTLLKSYQIASVGGK